MGITVTPTALDGVLLVEAQRFDDDRGFFMESYRRDRYHEIGIGYAFVQDNHSRSRRGVLRGLHLQDPSAPMAKLVRCSAGEVLDVAVDLRSESPTFGRFVSAVLSDANQRQLLVPEGFGHGFVTLSESADVEYKCSNYYAPDSELTLAWNDPELAIDWGVAEPIVSAKDEAGISLRQYRELPAGRRF
jgi:dTDP-4-dehydrorhamnose 3,5-epimerase